MNRRELFAAGVVAAAAVAAPIAVQAAIQSDADLISLGHEWERGLMTVQAAIARRKAAFDRCKASEPTPPTDLTLTRQDAWDFGGQINREVGETASGMAIVWIRDWLKRDYLTAGAPRRCERARQIIAAWEDHDRAILRNEVASGLVRACEVEAEAYEALDTIENRIVAVPCRSLEGLKVKARVAKRLLYPVDHVDNDWRDTAAVSVLDDLLRMDAH